MRGLLIMGDCIEGWIEKEKVDTVEGDALAKTIDHFPFEDE